MAFPPFFFFSHTNSEQLSEKPYQFSSPICGGASSEKSIVIHFAERPQEANSCSHLRPGHTAHSQVVLDLKQFLPSQQEHGCAEEDERVSQRAVGSHDGQRVLPSCSLLCPSPASLIHIRDLGLISLITLCPALQAESCLPPSQSRGPMTWPPSCPHS